MSVLPNVSVLLDFSFTVISGVFSKNKLQCSNILKSNRYSKKAMKAAKIKFRISSNIIYKIAFSGGVV